MNISNKSEIKRIFLIKLKLKEYFWWEWNKKNISNKSEIKRVLLIKVK